MTATLTADETLAIARILGDVVQARETGRPPHYPLSVVRMVTEELHVRIATANLNEWVQQVRKGDG